MFCFTDVREASTHLQTSGQRSMLTKDHLARAFSVYFDEMERCKQSKCYWALLHLVIVLPDVCAALEADNGETKRDLFKDWCKRNLENERLNPADWYRIRCALLHQGRTSDDKGDSQYMGYSFGQPSGNGVIVHNGVRVEKEGKLIHCDAGEIAKEVRSGIEKWFTYLLENASPKIVENVERNLEHLAQVQPGMPLPISAPIQSILSATTCSPSSRRG